MRVEIHHPPAEMPACIGRIDIVAVAPSRDRGKLVPGMAATVEITTGDRPVTEFLLASLFRYRDESLRER